MESESETKPGLLDSELESQDAGIRIRIGIKFIRKHWNWNQNWDHLLLESESESFMLVNPCIRIRIGITCY